MKLQKSSKKNVPEESIEEIGTTAPLRYKRGWDEITRKMGQ